MQHPKPPIKTIIMKCNHCNGQAEFTCYCKVPEVTLCSLHLLAHRKEQGCHNIVFLDINDSIYQSLQNRITELKLQILKNSELLKQEIKDQTSSLLEILNSLYNDLHLSYLQKSLDCKIEESISWKLDILKELEEQDKSEREKNNFYKGQVKEGKKEGCGVWICDKNVFIGNFIEDERYGKGMCLYAEGDVYDGEWENGVFNGKGTYKLNDGEMFVGEFMGGEYHGEGVLSFCNGDRYEGNFAHDQMSGKGVYYHANGDVYEGEWKENKKHGDGIKTLPNGVKYSQRYLNDQLVKYSQVN